MGTNHPRTTPRAWAGFALVTCLGGAACDPPAAPDAAGFLEPDPITFPAVADALQPSCATLDCHGQVARNLRLYGGRGLRLDPADNGADGATTSQEYQANFHAIAGLEPEAMDAVLRGDDPERLSLIRKARGTERHKGGTQMLRNDPLDLCLIAWVTGRSAVDACKRVTTAGRPAPITAGAAR